MSAKAGFSGWEDVCAMRSFGVSVRGRYQGDGIGLVDDKGRVAIPAALRSILSANAPKANGKDGGTIIIGAHQKSRCLVAYDPGYVDVLAERLDRLEAANLSDDGDIDYNAKRAGASGEAVPFDGSGRFIMPAFPRFFAGIKGHAFFYGVLDYIEIWDPATLIATPDIPAVVREMARFYMAEKGVAL